MPCLPYLFRRRPVRRIFRLRPLRCVNPPKLRLAPLPSGFLPQPQPPAARHAAFGPLLPSRSLRPEAAAASRRSGRCGLLPDAAVFDREEGVRPAGLVQNPAQTGGVAVRNDDLPERIFRHQPYELFHAPRIELVEQVVEQQDRLLAFLLRDYCVLGQFQGDQERLLLALRAVFAQGVAADSEHQIVAVNARRGELVGQILLPRGEENLTERTVVQFRFVVQFDLLAVARKYAVILRRHGLQPLGELPPPGVNPLALFDELHVVNLQHRLVGHVLEQPVALGQHGVVAHHGGQIAPVQLRDEGVEVAAPFVRGVADQGAVRRRYDHGGDKPHVVREPFVLLAVAFEHFAAFAREGAHDVFALSPSVRYCPSARKKSAPWRMLCPSVMGSDDLHIDR